MRSAIWWFSARAFGCFVGSTWANGDRLGFTHLLRAVTKAFELMAFKRLEHMAKIVGVGAVDLGLVVQLEVFARLLQEVHELVDLDQRDEQRYLGVLVDHRHECGRARSQLRARGRYHHVGCVGGAFRRVQVNDDIEVA